MRVRTDEVGTGPRFRKAMMEVSSLRLLSNFTGL
jgi:hypothetical protein